jgi:hypothetical protein
MDSEKANEAGKHLYLIVVVSVIILMLVTEATSYFGVYSLVVLLAIHLWIMARNNTLQFVNNIILPALLRTSCLMQHPRYTFSTAPINGIQAN